MATVINNLLIGEVGVQPGQTALATTSVYDDLITSGFLNAFANKGYSFKQGDYVWALYDTNGTPTNGIFTVNIVGRNFNLSPLSVADGSIINADIAANAAIAFSKLAALTSGNIIVGSAGNVPTSVPVSGDATLIASGALTIANNAITTVKITDANVTLSKLSAGITPSHVIKFAGRITWSGSGASLTTTVTGVASTDEVVATIRSAPTQAAYIVSATTNTNQVILTLSAANTSNDAVITYEVIRVAS